MGAALVGGAWGGQRLGVVHVTGATMGLMAVVCVVWADVEGAPTDGMLHSCIYLLNNENRHCSNIHSS